MNVLHLVRSMDVGGLETVVIGLVDGNRSRGVRPHLGCLYGFGAQGHDVDPDGCWIGSLDKNGRLKTLISLSKYVRVHEIDVIHTHNPQPHLFGVLAGALSRTPVVHTKHGRNYPGNAKRVWLNRQLSRFTKKVVAVSEAAAEVARDIERVPPAKLMVILNGIDTTKFAPSTDSQSATSDVTIGTVGRLSKEKNYPMLVRAFVILRRQLPNLDTQLLFVGDGPERPAIDAEARKQGVHEHCEFAGMQSEVEVWLKRIDVFCLSSITEGTSMTLLEAGASGVPAVVTDVGGNGEIVADGKSGVVVPAGDEEALSGALVRLVEDKEVREQMGVAARQRIIERYSIESMVEAYAEVYGEAISGR